MVNNGSTFNKELITIIKNYKMKVTVSLPSVKCDVYQKITGQSSVTPDKIVENIRILSHHVPVFVNYFLCNKCNTNKEDILEFINLIRSTGAESIMFIEIFNTVASDDETKSNKLYYPVDIIL